IPPLASLATYIRPTNTVLHISVADLIASFTSDGDGDALTLVSIGAGTNGATISWDANSITYTPSTTNPNRNTTDHFVYAVRGGFVGGRVSNRVAVVVSGADPATNPPLVKRVILGTNNVQVTFHGLPGLTYHLERAATLVNGTNAWTDLGTTTTDGSG